MGQKHDNSFVLEKTLPTVLVIFGITGDLSRRKLLPALWHLFRTEQLPEKFHIIGFARRDFSGDAIKRFISDALGSSLTTGNETLLADFLNCFSYQQGHFDDKEQYKTLAISIASVEQEMNVVADANRILYLAVAPVHYDSIFEALHESRLTTPPVGSSGQTRILVEKPFGRDTQTAATLDKRLGILFKEEQIYRIDHYLAKETVQNILNFRFSNFIFESIWNNQGIERVHIELLETLGMEGRGMFYNDTGALRDVGQNHLLQLLAVVAMDNPSKFDAEHIRAKRSEILSMLQPMEAVDINSVHGQYEGFTEELDVSNTKSETYFMLRTFLDHPKWKGVPFILESGKRMKEAVTKVTIYFKNATRSLCSVDDGNGCQNTLVFEISPKEGITVCFWAKKPGFSSMLEKRALHFSYGNNTQYNRIPDAYERVLFDGIRGDQTLFASTNEVQAEWRYITPIIQSWESIPLGIYTPGSRGPEERLKIINDGLNT